LNLYATDRTPFDEVELSLLQDLASNVTYGIAALRATSGT